MKSRKPLLAVLTAGSMLLAGSLLAQDQPMPPPAPATPPATPMPQPQPAPQPMSQPMTQQAAPTAAPGSTQFNTPQGQVTVKSTMPPVAAGPAPSFEQLSGGSRYITEDQATAYPLLANDFLYVDKGHAGHITKAQYERWLSNKQ